MNNLESDQLVVVGRAAGNEEQRRVSTVDNLCICVYAYLSVHHSSTQ